jgi:hypothetical protein
MYGYYIVELAPEMYEAVYPLLHTRVTFSSRKLLKALG